MYNLANRNLSDSALGNCIPHKSYVDLCQLRQQKLSFSLKAWKKWKENDKPHPLNMQCTKGTFLEYIEKKEAKTPSPHTYSPHDFVPAYKKKHKASLPERRTIFA